MDKFNTWYPRLTAAMMRSGSAVQTKGLVCVVFGEVAVDRGLEIEDGSEDAALNRRLVSLAKKPSTALSQDAEVGVKWNVQRGCRAKPSPDFGVLVGGVIVEDHVDQPAGRDVALEAFRKRINS